jgi:hypothetical protein
MSEYDLRSFGWAPGGYTGRKCVDCLETLWMVDKRAWRCQPCALKRYEEHAKVIDAPMICDYDEQTGRIG